MELAHKGRGTGDGDSLLQIFFVFISLCWESNIWTVAGRLKQEELQGLKVMKMRSPMSTSRLPHPQKPSSMYSKCSTAASNMTNKMNQLI